MRTQATFVRDVCLAVILILVWNQDSDLPLDSCCTCWRSINVSNSWIALAQCPRRDTAVAGCSLLTVGIQHCEACGPQRQQQPRCTCTRTSLTFHSRSKVTVNCQVHCTCAQGQRNAFNLVVLRIRKPSTISHTHFGLQGCKTRV